MTFSDRRVVDLVNERMIPVWESVAPVSIAKFDLGDGRVVKGTMGGEIALYFCRPDGKAFDILPALHSPHATYWAIRNALEFYDRTKATDEAIKTYHMERSTEMRLKGVGLPTPETEKALARRRRVKDTTDGGTKAMIEMTMSKSGVFEGSEPLTVVEPGGMELHKRAVHEAMSIAAPDTPSGWKERVFENILQEELKGGEFDYKVDTLAPISIIED